MSTPFSPGPSTEDMRIATLRALDLLDTVAEKEFDALVALAADLLDCPTALLSLIDGDRQWIKAAHGSEITETPRAVAFCDHTIRSDAPLVVPDAALDPRFEANPLVLGAPHIRFYAGAPIHGIDANGGRHAIGAICVIDGAPRECHERGRVVLAHLATLAEALIGARSTARQALAIAQQARDQSTTLRRQDRSFRQAERLAQIGSWRYRLEDEALEWSEGVYRIHEVDHGTEIKVHQGLEFYPPHARAAVSAALTRTIETGAPFDIETDLITATGRQRRVRAAAELEIEAGRAVSVVGVFRDVTDQYRLEKSLRESASIDTVTRIANRAAFNDRMETSLCAAQADGSPLMLLLIDLDHFKTTNDSFGHLAGDDVLRTVGQRMRAPFLKGSFAARLGGDEFALIVTDPALIADVGRTVDNLLMILRTSVQSQDLLLPTSSTIGIAHAGPGQWTLRELMHAADTALYAAKRDRRGTSRIHADRRAG